jgi:hypothetical protein
LSGHLKRETSSSKTFGISLSSPHVRYREFDCWIPDSVVRMLLERLSAQGDGLSFLIADVHEVFAEVLRMYLERTPAKAGASAKIFNYFRVAR